MYQCLPHRTLPNFRSYVSSGSEQVLTKPGSILETHSHQYEGSGISLVTLPGIQRTRSSNPALRPPCSLPSCTPNLHYRTAFPICFVTHFSPRIYICPKHKPSYYSLDHHSALVSSYPPPPPTPHHQYPYTLPDLALASNWLCNFTTTILNHLT